MSETSLVERMVAAVTGKHQNFGTAQSPLVGEDIEQVGTDSGQYSISPRYMPCRHFSVESMVDSVDYANPPEPPPEPPQTIQPESSLNLSFRDRKPDMALDLEYLEEGDVSPRLPAAAPGKVKISSRTSSAIGDIAPQSLSQFQKHLVHITSKAPVRYAEKMIERLEQRCIDEASSGRTSVVFEMQLPSSRRFNDAVGRSFAGKLKELGFQSVEWWSSKEWKEMVGKYCILHETMYDKYQMRLRVTWPETYGGHDDDVQEENQNTWEQQTPEITDAALAPLLQQMRQIFQTQQSLLVRCTNAQAAAEERVACAMSRAAYAEKLRREFHASNDTDSNKAKKLPKVEISRTAPIFEVGNAGLTSWDLCGF